MQAAGRCHCKKRKQRGVQQLFNPITASKRHTLCHKLRKDGELYYLIQHEANHLNEKNLKIVETAGIL